MSTESGIPFPCLRGRLFDRAGHCTRWSEGPHPYEVPLRCGKWLRYLSDSRHSPGLRCGWYSGRFLLQTEDGGVSWHRACRVPVRSRSFPQGHHILLYRPEFPDIAPGSASPQPPGLYAQPEKKAAHTLHLMPARSPSDSPQ